MSHSPKVICIGAAVQDVFMRGKIFTPQHEEDGDVEEFKLGSKNDVEEVIFSTGGGATNAAVTFARHGFRSYYMGKVGKDVAARAVLEALEHDKVNTELVGTSQEEGTGYSVLLLAPGGERTILVYRGASTHYDLRTADFKGQTADWFYISSFEGNFDALDEIFDYAKKHRIKIAMNPGKKELQDPKRLKQFLPQLDVLSMNREEAKMIFVGETAAELAEIATQVVPVVVVTDGPKGMAACDQEKLVKAGMYEDVPVIDRTGAGDAFTSGFVAKIIDGEPIEKAVVFASANSTSVVSQIGAKAGILHKNAKLHDMPVKISSV